MLLENSLIGLNDIIYLDKMKKKISHWPGDGLEIVEECPVCGSSQREIIYSGLTDRIFFCAPGEWTLMCCQKCSSGYLNPRPSPATIGLAYQKYFTHNHNKPQSKPDTSIRQRLLWALANGYRNWRYATQLVPATRFGVLAAYLYPSKRRLLDRSMRHLPKPAEGQKLLDFGCGSGEFLVMAKSAGWQVVGIDLDPKAVSAAKAEGLEVYEGGSEMLSSWATEFDVITLSHVIEHVHEPLELLRACYDRMKPGGILWVETPNIASQGFGLFGRDWRGLEPPRHLVLFTPASLRGLLFKAGFNAVIPQPETPMIPSMYSQSEAIRAGEDPITEWEKWICLKRRTWRKKERNSRLNIDIREFITIKAVK